MRVKRTIGLLTPFLGGNYHEEIINAVQRAAHRFGVRLIAIRTIGKNYHCPIAMEHVDGWIILNNAVTDDFIRELDERWHKPIVAIAKDLNTLQVNGQTIYCDNEGGIIEAVRHLYEHGHRDIGFFFHMGLDDMSKRLNGYKIAIEQLGLPYNPNFIIDMGDLSVLGGRNAAQQIVDAGFPFRSAVVCTDMAALGILERLMELGCRVPEDMALIGFDNTDSSKTCKPSLTSIEQHTSKAGTAAVELLLKQIGQHTTASEPYVIDCSLVTRESCGCSGSKEEGLLAEQLLEAHTANKTGITQLTLRYEFNKFIQNNEIETIKHLSWVLAPYFKWASLGIWDVEAPVSANLTISEWYHFQRNEDLIAAAGVESLADQNVMSFPPFDCMRYEQLEDESEMTYIIPYRTVQNNWSVFAASTTLEHTIKQMNEFMSVVHYLDYIASTLDRQALVKEVKEQSLQYRQIAEQLEIVSRTSNDGIWDLNLVTGVVEWNQRFYDLLGADTAHRFEDLLHSDDITKYNTAFQAHLEYQSPFMIDARLRKKSGQYVWVAISGEAVRNHDGGMEHIVGSVRDITERKQAEEKMSYLAYHDALTGLTNRRRFYEEIMEAADNPDQPFAVIVLDLDHFKKVNDSFGHQMGDRLLQLVADGLKALVRQNDHIARFGGDEFVVLYRYEDLAEVECFALSISKSLSSLLLDERINLTITISAGVSIFPRDGADPDTLIKKADIAMYKVKQSGKNQYEIFSPQMIEQTMWRINTENELKEAIKKKQFVLHYQPQVHLETGELFGVEALLRLHSPTQGMISPLSFIPLAEETGLIHQIGEWVLTEACEQSVEWLKKGYGPIKISVNISGRQFRKPDFADRVKRIIETTGMDPHYLCMEITESTVIDDIDATLAMFKQLSDLGIQMSMDDFGTGYSSLSMLRKLPLNMLKIDKSFIREMTYEHQDFDIVKAIISISNSLKLNIVAEGVEEKEQFDLLKELGCHYIQGYYISKPLTSEQFEKQNFLKN